MTIEEIRKMPDDELFTLSLEKSKIGNATAAANMAYMERKRRSGCLNDFGRGSRSSKYQADIDYYGSCEISNR